MLSRLKPLALLAPLLATHLVVAPAAPAADDLNPLDVPFTKVGGAGPFAAVHPNAGGLVWNLESIERDTGVPICYHLPGEHMPEHERITEQARQSAEFVAENVSIRQALDTVLEAYPDFVWLERPGPMIVVLPAVCVQNPDCALFKPVPRIVFDDATAGDVVARFRELDRELNEVPAKFSMSEPNHETSIRLKWIPLSMTIEDGVLMDVLNRPLGTIGYLKWSYTPRVFNWSNTSQKFVETVAIRRARTYAKKRDADPNALFARYEEAVETAPWPILKNTMRVEYAEALLNRPSDRPNPTADARDLLRAALEDEKTLVWRDYGSWLVAYANLANNTEQVAFARDALARAKAAGSVQSDLSIDGYLPAVLAHGAAAGAEG